MPFTSSTPRLWWEAHGTDGSPVLLIMGFAMRGIVWRPQLEHLPRHHRVVIFDHRGLGQSEDAPGRWKMVDLARDAVRVMDEAGMDRAHVVGVSMGGMVAQELALRWPARVRSLGLLVTHAGDAMAWRPTRQAFAAVVEARTRPNRQRLDGLVRLLYPDEYLETVDPVAFRQSLQDRIGYQAPRGTVLRQLGAILRHRTSHRLHTLDVPTLVVRAGRDVLIAPRHCERLAARIPGARLLDLPDAGHGVIHQCRDEVNEALLAHFRASEGGRAAG